MHYSKDMNQTAMMERKTSRQNRVAALTKRFEQTAPVDKSRRIEQLQSEISEYEKRFGMTTGAMQSQICSGQAAESGAFADWNRKARLLRGHQYCGKTKTG